jgi:integrase
MALDIHKVRVRAALKPRREPYWGPMLAKGRTVGFRKIDDERGSWIARLRDEHGVDRYKALGHVSEQFGYEAARAAALKWFEAADAGVSSDVVTVTDACKEYVEDRRREKGEATAHDAQKRFERTIYGKPFGAVALSKLRTPRIKIWRDSLGLSKPSADRTLTALKAALNLAVTNRCVHLGAAREWADVAPYGAKHGKRRDLFLDIEQRRALLKAAQGAVRDLMEGAALTGARAGELVHAKRSQFDARTGIMAFIGKTGRRDVPLSPAALVLFKRLAKDKLPAALLFVRDDGKPWAHSDWDELVRGAADLARVPAPAGSDKEPAKLPAGVCLYTLRHSFITQAITSGMTTLEVARLVGTSLVMIEKHYGHLVADAARERLAKVEML